MLLEFKLWIIVTVFSVQLLKSSGAPTYMCCGTTTYCINQIDQCSKYEVPDPDVCQGCESGYVCTSPQTIQCKECNTLYVLSNLLCWKQIANCATQNQNTCSSCASGFQLQPFNSTVSICIKLAIKDCLYYALDSTCTNCTTKFHLYNNACYNSIIQCSSYLDGTHCSTCNTGYWPHTNQTFCYQEILNCQLGQTKYLDETQTTYCSNCNTNYLKTENNLCSADDPNCQLFSSDLTQCVKCMPNYIKSATTCQQCPIKYCLSCTTSSIFGKICSQCQTNFIKGPNAQTCIGACESSSSLTSCVTCANKVCTSCADGYYLNSSSQCVSCVSKYASCDTCSLNKCTSCTNGYYFDNSKSYCFQCTTLNAGCSACLNTLSTGTTNNVICQKCESGYILSSNQLCIKCSQLFENCDTCKNLGDKFQCLTCLPGTLSLTDESNNQYCLDCSGSVINIPHCYTCLQSSTPSKYKCTLCQDGYFAVDDQTCLACPSTCTRCTSATVCTGCQTTLILANSQCTNDATAFSLTTTSNSEDALAYTNILISSNSLGPYPTIGSLNSKGYFCQSDKQCNMNGRCLLISCKCIKNMAASRCQFTTTSDFLKLQQEMLIYLNSQTTYKQNYIDTLLLLADTTFSVTESTIKNFQDVLSKYISMKFDVKYFTIIGAISKNIFGQETIATQKLTNLDQLLFNATIKQSDSMMISEIQNTTGPYHKQIIGKFDLNSEDSFQIFKTNFVKSYGVCDNEKKFLTPQIYLTLDNVQEIKTLQSDASTPLIFNQMHLYYQSHRSSGQTINSTVSRIQFIKSGSQLSISGIPAVIVVPKADQQFADLNENNICVTWNEDKQIWENAKATLLKCKYYTVCQVDHFSDFGTYVQVVKNITVNQSGLKDILYINTDFEFRKAVQNCAFAISMTLFGLFFVLLTLLCILFKMPKKPKRSKSKTSNTYEFGQSGFHQEQQLDTERQVIQKINNGRVKKPKNFWSVYPVNAIFTASSLEISLQKLSLYLLQIQMYVTFTSVYLSSLPFKFGMLTAYYLLAIIQTWVCNYLFGGLALAFRKKSKGKVLGFYWFLFIVIFFGNMIIGIWQMYGVEFKFDMYLLVGVIIEYVLDAIFCDLFLTYLYQSLFINEVVGIFKIIKFKGYYEQ